MILILTFIAAAGCAVWMPESALLPALVGIATVGSVGLLARLPGRSRTLPPASERQRPTSAGGRPDVAEMRERLVRAQGRQADAVLLLGPLLAEIASERLAARGLNSVLDPRGLVNDATWTLIRPDRRLPENRRATGPTLAELNQIISQVEAL